MVSILIYMRDLLLQTLQAVGGSLAHNRYVLAFSILLAVGLKTYVNSEKLSAILFRRKKISILASVLFGAVTPLCACGTTAVLIGMLTTALPWGPIMAFLTSSPLMSPDGFVLISGVIGLRFAVALTAASIVIGIASGLITNMVEKKTRFLENQSRFMDKAKEADCSCGSSAAAASCSCNQAAITASCGCGTDNKKADSIYDSTIIKEDGDQLCCQEVSKRNNPFSKLISKLKLREFLKDLYDLGFKQILVFYSIFIAIGFLINHFIPTSIITVLFGANAFYAVPLASLIGLPLYITTDSGIPIIHSMLQSGASEGAMLAFMITGSATSAWVIAGLSTFMKKRAIMLYLLFVLSGGIITGYLYELVRLLLL